MIRICFAVSIVIFLIGPAQAQVPSFGNDTLLDVACWNMEWFGDATSGNGPSNEALQFSNVKQVLSNSNIDVWALEEVSDALAWSNLLAALPAYQGTIATYSQTQKTALIFQRDKFEMLSSSLVLNDASCNCSYDFASGRFPLEVVLRTKGSAWVDTIYFYVIHLKAFADQTSYNRRFNAALQLKKFLDQQRAGKKVVVLGDWNDELKGSIVGANASPFDQIQTDTARYFFISRQLSDQNKKSYASASGRMIDHILVSKDLKEQYVPASSRVLDVLPSYISGYTSNTSDHYPVMGYFNLRRYLPTTGLADRDPEGTVPVFPNPSNGVFAVEAGYPAKVTMLDMQGRETEMEVSETAPGFYECRAEMAPTGIYMVLVNTAESQLRKRIVIAR